MNEQSADTNVALNECDVTIIIKALNEENYIENSILSAFSALKNLNGEVILADSISTDRTIEIATRHPVRIIQLAHPQERSCGAGPQLGYQEAKGAFLYILDGDMQLQPDFIEYGIELMNQQQDIAGVAGIVSEKGTGNYEFKVRKDTHTTWKEEGEQTCLEMGGLYRREAIDSVGYFSNRNLHAFEELELGLRLKHKGWRLLRTEKPSVIHYGETSGSYQLIRSRWRSRYIDGSGEIVRAAIGQPYFLDITRDRLNVIVMASLFLFVVATLVVIPISILPLLLSGGMIGMVIVFMCIRQRSIRHGLIGASLWPVKIAGFFRGLLRKQIDPTIAISSKIIATGSSENLS